MILPLVILYKQFAGYGLETTKVDTCVIVKLWEIRDGLNLAVNLRIQHLTLEVDAQTMLALAKANS